MSPQTKKAKHIISYACDKSCSYCINEVKEHDERQCKDDLKILTAYHNLCDMGVEHLMISGGEPVVNTKFEYCLSIASGIFDVVSIITAHQSALSNSKINWYADDVLFSVHLEYLDTFDHLRNTLDIPVYVSMVYETYQILKRERRVQEVLRDRGFDGLTVREMYPHGEKIKKPIEPIEDFSLRVYTKDRCEGEDMLLLPDLSIQHQPNFVKIK